MHQTIIVTGFGAFHGVDSNPSSDIVDRIQEVGIPGYDGKIITQKVNVDYCEVEKTVEELWGDEPTLVVHIGVDASAFKEVRLEKQAFRNGYYYADINGSSPEDAIARCNDVDTLCCTMDLEEVARIVNKTLDDPVRVTLSEDPGRYLCGYIYYHSLSKKSDRSLFIHVSNFTDDFTLKDETDIVCQIILELLKQRKQSCGCEAPGNPDAADF